MLIAMRLASIVLGALAVAVTTGCASSATPTSPSAILQLPPPPSVAGAWEVTLEVTGCEGFPCSNYLYLVPVSTPWTMQLGLNERGDQIEGSLFVSNPVFRLTPHPLSVSGTVSADRRSVALRVADEARDISASLSFLNGAPRMGDVTATTKGWSYRFPVSTTWRFRVVDGRSTAEWLGP